MSDLTASLILRLVDRLSAPSRAAAKSLGMITVAQREVGKASSAAGNAVDGAAKQTTGFARTAELAAKGSGILNSALIRQTGTARSADAATGALAGSQQGLDRSLKAVERTLTGATVRLGAFERMQHHARAAGRMLGSELDKLDGKLGTLAKGSLAAGAAQVAGRSILGPIGEAVSRQAAFNRLLIGARVVGDLDAKGAADVRANVMATASAYGLPLDRVMGVHGAVLNEGGYRGAGDIGYASRGASKMQLLAGATGDPVEDNEAGALSSVYAFSLGIPANAIERFNAMLFESSKLGGTRLGTVIKNMPAMMGKMKSFGFGNAQGFADAATAFQIVKRTTGDDTQAAIFTNDLMASIGHKHTQAQFRASGVDLLGSIAAGQKLGKSPLEVMVEKAGAIISKIPDDAHRASKLMQLTGGNVQSGGALLGLVQNWKDGPNGPGFVNMRRQVLAAQDGKDYGGAIKLITSDNQTQLDKLKVAIDQLSIETGKVLAPQADRLAGSLTGVTQRLTEIVKNGGPLGAIAATAAGGFGILAASAGTVGNAIVGVLGPVWIMRGVFGRVLPLAVRAGAGSLASFAGRALPLLGGGLLRAIPAVLSFSAALLASPITWIVGGIAAIGLGAFLIWKNWKPISAFFVGMWRNVKAGFGSAIGWIGGQVGRFAAIGGALMHGLAHGIMGALGTVKGSIMHAAAAVVQWMKDRLGIRSPSREFALIGGYSMEGLALGITGTAYLAGRAAHAAGGRLALAAAAGLMAPNIALAVAASAVPPASLHGHDAPSGRQAVGRASGGDVVIHNTFRISAAGMDVRQLAREMNRVQDEAMRRALHDRADA